MGICSWHGGVPEPCDDCAHTAQEFRDEAFRLDPSLKEEIEELKIECDRYRKVLQQLTHHITGSELQIILDVLGNGRKV